MRTKTIPSTPLATTHFRLCFLKPAITMKAASGMTREAINQWEAGWVHTFPNAGRIRRTMGVAAQWIAQRMEATTPMRSPLTGHRELGETSIDC